jgi:hypothetical protein
VIVNTASPWLASLGEGLAGGSSAISDLTEEGEVDLWAAIAAAASGRRLDLVLAPARPGGPVAFAAAWAERAMDKAKLSGPFAAAIPKPNLAQLKGLGAAG